MSNDNQPERRNRSQPESLRARSLSASLTVNDLQASLHWYRDVVGFTVDREIEREGRVVAIALKAGDVRVMLNQDDGAKGQDRIKGQGISLMFTTAQDIDAIAARITERGGKLGMQPTDMPWGARIFHVQDPNGFKLVFARPAE